jgi:hypothetical protein
MKDYWKWEFVPGDPTFICKKCMQDIDYCNCELNEYMKTYEFYKPKSKPKLKDLLKRSK